jgi:hypothetical protein
MTPLEGGCACGRVRFRITQLASTVAVCHCRRCQRFAGGGPNYSLIVPRGGLEIVEGTPRPVELQAERGMRVDRMFCGDCGTQLYSDAVDRPYTPVRLGALDDPSPWRPAFHMWVEAAQPWHFIDETLPRYARGPN